MKYLFFGYSIPKETFLSSIIKGGGVISMLKAIFMTFISCSLAGLLDSAGFLKGIHNLFDGVNSRCRLFIATAIISILTAAFGGNQSIAIVLTIQIMKDFYEKMDIDKYQFAIDIENTAVVLSPMIPWNISGVIPAMTLGVSSFKYLPYAFYIYLIPIINMMFLKVTNKTSKNNCVS
jgi:NhaC family Na+:H+ antiporter